MDRPSLLVRLGWRTLAPNSAWSSLALVAAVIGGCGPNVPTPSVANGSPAATATASVARPSPVPTASSVPPSPPPDPGLLKLVPAALRGNCAGTDLTDAKPEIDCADGTVDLYLARWPSADAVRAAFQEEVSGTECDLLDLVDGTILSGKAVVGRAHGCTDDPTLQFTNEAAKLQGTIFLDGQSLFDAQLWLRDQRPGFPDVAKLDGTAFGPAVGSLPLKALIARAETVPYKTLARNIEDYADRLVHYRARVLQVTDDGALVLVTNDNAGWHDIVFITYTSVDRLLEDDTVEFVGRGAGEYEYVTVAGDERSVPQLDVIDIAIR